MAFAFLEGSREMGGVGEFMKRAWGGGFASGCGDATCDTVAGPGLRAAVDVSEWPG